MSPEVAVTLREIVLVIRQISEAQREQAEVLREVKEGLGLLLDRVPRHEAPMARAGMGGD